MNEEVKFLKISKKKYFFFFFLGGGRVRGGGVRVSEVIFFLGGSGRGGRVGGSGWGCQGRCEQRSEVFVKIQKIKIGGGGGGSGWGGVSGWRGIRMDVKEELKLL